jgi:hypothetical protein
MRAVNLVKVAAQAEVLRLQYMMKRQGMRVASGLIATIFAMGVLAFAHVAAWQLLRMYVDGLYATLILLVIDLVLAAVFGLMAAKSSPSQRRAGSARCPTSRPPRRPECACLDRRCSHSGYTSALPPSR